MYICNKSVVFVGICFILWLGMDSCWIAAIDDSEGF